MYKLMPTFAIWVLQMISIEGDDTVDYNDCSVIVTNGDAEVRLDIDQTDEIIVFSFYTETLGI